MRFIGLFIVVSAIFLALALRLAFYPFSGETRTPDNFGVAYTAHTIETADGERLRAWHIPRADAVAQVVYFHGNGGNLSVWSEVLIAIATRGYEVIAIDYRGFGLSTGAPTEQGLYRDVEATVRFVDHDLRRPDLPVIYWGRSIGTAMAAYAAQHRAPDGVILEAGFPNARAIFAGNPIMYGLSFFATYRFPTADWMARVTSPALVIHGDADHIIPFTLGQRLFESLPGPKQFVAIPGGGHNDPAPADGAAYWGAVKAFVTSTSASPRR